MLNQFGGPFVLCLFGMSVVCTFGITSIFAILQFESAHFANYLFIVEIVPEDDTLACKDEQSQAHKKD